MRTAYQARATRYTAFYAIKTLFVERCGIQFIERGVDLQRKSAPGDRPRSMGVQLRAPSASERVLARERPLRENPLAGARGSNVQRPRKVLYSNRWREYDNRPARKRPL